jgi:hypothetical protein
MQPEVHPSIVVAPQCQPVHHGVVVGVGEERGVVSHPGHQSREQTSVRCQSTQYGTALSMG